MNRHPSRSRTDFDSFFSRDFAHLKGTSPGADFFEPRHRLSAGMRLLVTLAVLLALVLLCNTLCNFFVFTRQLSVPVRHLSEAFDGYTILHLSDLKGELFGSGQSRLIAAIRGKRYDVVVMTGDMISPSGNAEPFYALLDALRELNPKAPVYFIPGDSDPPVTSMTYSSGGTPFAPWVLGAQQRGAILLSSPVQLTRGAQALWLSASQQLTLDVSTMRTQFEQQYAAALTSGDAIAQELAAYNLDWLKKTQTARDKMTEDDVFITLTHTPPAQDELSRSSPDSLIARTDLMLCGHYLGGLTRLPFIGPVFVPSRTLPRYGLFPGAGAFTSLEKQGSTRVYTNPGLGAGDRLYPPMLFRLFNPPRVTLLELTPSAL